MLELVEKQADGRNTVRCMRCGAIYKNKSYRCVNDSRRYGSKYCRECMPVNKSKPKAWLRVHKDTRKSSAPSTNPMMQDDIVTSGSKTGEFDVLCKCGCGKMVSKFDPYCEDYRRRKADLLYRHGKANFSGMVVAA